LEFGEKVWKNQKRLLVAFLFLWLFTSVGIFLHELGHHILGIPSELGLSRNWPPVPVTKDNKCTEIVGTLDGPAFNLFIGLANAFLLVVATAANFGVDLVFGTTRAQKPNTYSEIQTHAP
jgi:hypothetical protein